MNEQNNIKIAEFLGFVFYDEENKYYNIKEGYFLDSIDFIRSWDLLIFVIKEIDSLMLNMKISKKFDELSEDIFKSLRQCDKELTYTFIIKFITQFRNENSNT